MESWQGHGNSNPDAEWILCEPWVLVRSGLDLAQSPSAAPVGRGVLRTPVRTKSLGRNTGHVSDPGQGDALLVEARTTLHPLRLTESSAGLLLLPAGRTRCQPSPTDPHSLLKCPNCGSVQDSTVCSGPALAKKDKNQEKRRERKNTQRKNMVLCFSFKSSCTVVSKNKQTEEENKLKRR